MKKSEVLRRLEAVVEDLARIEHERWSAWQRYLHGKGKRITDGSVVLPPDLVRRWDRQIATDYDSLSEIEKASDRDQIRKHFPTLIEALCDEDD